MWVLKNKKYGNYYQSTLSYGYHFVTYIEEAAKMGKRELNKLFKGFNHKENYEMVKVKEWKKKYQKMEEC